ncbi:MAG: hypothetical protein KDD47_23275 [Acidobacteria bacterium]|nr:hypothetical protein [Acidobacteriota bacterium]
MISLRTLKLSAAACLLAAVTAIPGHRAAADALLDAAAGSEIQTVFGAYKAAIIENNGQEALKLVSRNTIEYFERTRDLALYGQPAEIQEHTLTDRLQIAHFRVRIPVETLKNFSAEQLFVYTAEHGWLGGNSISPVSLGELSLDGDSAEAGALVNGQPVPFKVHFHREDGAWKLDLVALLAVGDSALHQRAEQSAITGDDLILRILSGATGSEVTDSVWQPLLARESGS